MLALQWEDIDFARHTVSVRASLQRIRSQLVRAETKTKASVRTLRVPDALLATLQAHRERQQTEGYSGSYVFTSTAGTPLEPRNVWRQFKSLLRRAGLPEMRFHDLRHSAATLMIAQGVHLSVIKDILGHTQISTTADIYGHVLPDTQCAALTSLDQLLSETP